MVGRTRSMENVDNSYDRVHEFTDVSSKAFCNDPLSTGETVVKRVCLLFIRTDPSRIVSVLRSLSFCPQSAAIRSADGRSWTRFARPVVIAVCGAWRTRRQGGAGLCPLFSRTPSDPCDHMAVTPHPPRSDHRSSTRAVLRRRATLSFYHVSPRQIYRFVRRSHAVVAAP